MTERYRPEIERGLADIINAISAISAMGEQDDNETVTLSCRCGGPIWRGSHRDFVMGSIYRRWYRLHRGDGHGMDRRLGSGGGGGPKGGRG